MDQDKQPRTKLGRRNVLRTALMGGAAVAGVAAGVVPAVAARTGAERSAAVPTAGKAKQAGVTLRWLGVSGLEITFDGHVLYFDPYLSRFDHKANGGRLAPDPSVADKLLATGRLSGPPELIMISHSHWDHMGDVPDLLNRAAWKDAPISTIGTDTHRNLLQAMGTGAARISKFITASGGEDLSFHNGAYRVQVLRSVHSQSAGGSYFAPGLRNTPPSKPETTADLVEGGSLAYQVTVPDRLSVLMFGGTNYVERELAGLRPDVVALCLTNFSMVHQYLERLLTVLGGPKYVIPVHHDDMVTGFDDPNLPNTLDLTGVKTLKEVIRAKGLRTQVLEMRHLQTITL
ncbi:MBL fold metallo-hydrolase [Micromonospora sp. NPDC003197]